MFIKCLNCEDVLLTTHYHHCSCESISVDGPMDRPRIIGARSNWEEIKQSPTQEPKDE